MNEIFSHFISHSSEDARKRTGYVTWFNDLFPDSEFRGDDFIMKKYCDYCSRLSVPMRYDYFGVFLSTELKKLLIRTRVRLPGTDQISYEDPAGLQMAYTVAKEYLQNEFKILESYNPDISDFKVAVDAWMSETLNSRIVEELSHGYENLSSSADSEGTVEAVLDNFIMLKDIYDRSVIEDLDEDSMYDNGDTFNFLVDTGIPSIDSDIIGLHESQMISLDAQPGAGKTRFLLGCWIYRAAVMYKRNCIYYQLEQTKAEARAMLIARHVFTLYNIQVSSAMIQFNKVPEELKSKVKAAELDLFESGKYGKIYINNTDLYYETLAQTYKKDDKLHGPFDVIGLDYAGLVGQRSGGKYDREVQEYKVIAKTYRITKNYVRRTRKGALVVSQFNDKGIAAGEADKRITPNMVQGGIAAYRHSDQNLALTCSPTMKAQQKMRISQPKIRGTAGFDTTIVDTRLGICYFYQNAPRQI